MSTIVVSSLQRRISPTWDINQDYLISTKIRAPLIFFVTASSCSMDARKLKGEEKMPQMNENTENLQ